MAFAPTSLHLNYVGHGPSLACAARLCRIPVVSRAGGTFDPRNLLNKWTAVYIANCEAHAQTLLASPLASRVRITGDLFRPERLRAGALERPLPPPTGRPRFLFLGQLVQRKGLDVLVRAFARMTKDAELLLVGGNWADPGYPQALISLMNELGVRNRIHCENHRKDAAALIAASDVLVLPSLSEARPRVIIEAMCGGRPVIATKVGGIPEMIQDGVTGLLVPPSEVDPLSAALDQLAGSSDLRAGMGELGRAFAARSFHPEQTVTSYVELYRQVAFGRTGA